MKHGGSLTFGEIFGSEFCRSLTLESKCLNTEQTQCSIIMLKHTSALIHHHDTCRYGIDNLLIIAFALYSLMACRFEYAANAVERLVDELVAPLFGEVEREVEIVDGIE